MRWMAPLQSKIGKGEGTEAETIQVEFATPHKTKSRVPLSRKEERKLSEKKGKKKKEYGLEVFGVEKEGQSALRRFFENPIRFLLGNPQLTFDDIKTQEPVKPEVKPAKDGMKPRDKLAAELRKQANELEQQIMKEIHDFKPMGQMSEMAQALRLEPKKGEAVQTPFGLIVFARSRSPDKKTAAAWDERHKKSDELRGRALQYSFSIVPAPHITTGNYRVVEQGKKLHEQGLLTPEEVRELEKLEKFWQDHLELDRQKDVGMWNEKLELVPWKSSIGKPETKPEDVAHRHPEEKGIKPIPSPTAKDNVARFNQLKADFQSYRFGIDSPEMKELVELERRLGKQETHQEFKPNAGLINKQLADRSHMGTSWDPEKRAEQEIEGFVQDVQAVFDRLKLYARTEAQKALLIEEIQRFQTGYAQKYNEKLAAHGRTISSFITGASRFPTRRAEKANAAYDKKFQDVLDWKDRAEKAIIRKLKGEAIEEEGGEIPHLQKKLAQAEKLQEMMVEANKIIRKKHEPGIGGVSKHKQLVGLGFSEKQAAELLIPDFAARIGFSYHLANNNQEIRRLKERIAQLQRKEVTQTREFLFAGGHILDNQEDDGVQIFFDQKPSQDIISKLKGEGWHWSPSIGAWRRKRTEYALMSANRITGAQAETQFKVLKENPRDVIGDPPNFIMKLQLFKLWKEVLGAEDIGDFETFMKEAADLTYDEAKEKLLKTYGQPKQMTSGKEARFFDAKASGAEEKLHAGMCSSAVEECGKGNPEACKVACDECGIEEFCPPKKTDSWRKFPDHKSETKAVKEALKRVGIEAEVGHGRGTAWGWLEINIGDPRMRNGLKPPPFGYQYTEEEQALHNKVLKIAQEVTGRHGDYEGRISLLAQGWRKRQKPEVQPEKDKVSSEGLTKDDGRLRMTEGPLKGKTAFRCPECMRGLVDFVCGEHGRIAPEEAVDLRRIKTDPKVNKRARELFEYTLDEARDAGFPTIKAYYDSLKDNGFKQFLKLAVGLEDIFKKIEKQTVRPVKITPEAPRETPEVKTPTTRPETEAKPPLEVKPDVYTRKQKRAIRKPDIVYTEYGRTVVKKAKSGTIRLTDADMKADAIYISY